MFVLTICWTHATTQDQLTEQCVATSPDNYPMGGKEIAGSEVQRGWICWVCWAWMNDWLKSELPQPTDVGHVSHEPSKSLLVPSFDPHIEGTNLARKPARYKTKCQLLQIWARQLPPSKPKVLQQLCGLNNLLSSIYYFFPKQCGHTDWFLREVLRPSV